MNETLRHAKPSAAESASWLGVDAGMLARQLDVPALHAYGSVPSTLDVAHALAAGGAAAGTLVLAEEQTAGRGRSGAAWRSAPGAGIWLTLIGRPATADALDVLALRVGIRTARVLDRFTADPVRLKWPNDLWLPSGKLGGILAEARWRGERPDWVALGLGLNLVAPVGMKAAALVADVAPADVLAELVPALRAAMTATGPLSAGELTEFAARDLAAGRRCSAPLSGVVRGITAKGELEVETAEGSRVARSGSLVLEGG